MKELLQFLLGIVLTIIGVIIFLQNVVVSSFTLFYRMGRVNVGGILIVLIVVAFIAFIVKPNMLTGLSLIGLCIAFFVCLVISLNVSMRYMSGLELALGIFFIWRKPRRIKCFRRFLMVEKCVTGHLLGKNYEKRFI